MEINKSDIVLSAAGHDKGSYFIVVDIDERYAYIADGRRRRAQAPKRKSLKHVVFAGKCRTAAEKLARGESMTNKELMRGLAEFSAAPDGLPGGM